jgi:hypothetical protein
MAVLPAHTFAAQEKKPPKPKPAEPLADAPTGPRSASTCAAHAACKCPASGPQAWPGGRPRAVRSCSAGIKKDILELLPKLVSEANTARTLAMGLAPYDMGEARGHRGTPLGHSPACVAREPHLEHHYRADLSFATGQSMSVRETLTQPPLAECPCLLRLYLRSARRRPCLSCQ